MSRIIYYHNHCKKSYEYRCASAKPRETTPWHENRDKNKKAHDELCAFVNYKVVQGGHYFFLTSLKKLYDDRLVVEYDKELSDCTKDLSSSHHIEEKLLQSFKNLIKIITTHHKKIVKAFQGRILEEQDFTALETIDIMNTTALILRQQILNMEPDRIPDDLTANDLIKGEGTTLKAVQIFYETLLSGPSRRQKARIAK